MSSGAVSPVICKPLVSILLSADKSKGCFAYRIYLICKYEFYQNSGIFCLNQLMDRLFSYYNYKSLHHLHGNDRSKFKSKLACILSESVLFKNLGSGRFKFTPERHIIGSNKYNYSTKINISKESLCSQKKFNNLLIGALSAGNSLKSYNTLSKQSGFTKRRCFQACKENNESGIVKKQNNYIIVKSIHSKYLVNRERANLVFHNGIKTPDPVKYKGEWLLVLYAPNSYRVSLKAKPTKQKQGLVSSAGLYLTPYINNKKCRYAAIDNRSSLYLKINSGGLFTFRDENVGYYDYILENTDYESRGGLYGYKTA